MTKLSNEEIAELRDKAAIYKVWQNEYKKIDKFLKKKLQELEEDFPYSEGTASVATLKAIELYTEKVAEEKVYEAKMKYKAKYKKRG